MDEREEYGGTGMGVGVGADAEPGAIREAAGASRFDPTPYLRQLRGRGVSGEYLDVKWRLLWLRTEHPDARIETEHVQLEPSMAVFKATVTLPTGGMATGYGSETPGDFGDYIEKAETKAIGRALNALGYGAQFREPGDEESPSGARPAAGGRGPIQRSSGQSYRAAPAQPSREPRSTAPETSSRPIELNANRDRAADRSAPSDGVEQEGEGAFTWAAFREWVAGIGFNSREEINQLLGRDTSGMSPTELRDAIIAARA